MSKHALFRFLVVLFHNQFHQSAGNESRGITPFSLCRSVGGSRYPVALFPYTGITLLVSRFGILFMNLYAPYRIYYTNT